MFVRFISRGLLLVATSLFCLTVPVQQASSQTEGVQPALAENRLQAETAYTLGPQDRLLVDVFNVLEESTEFLVLVDGTISLPLIGSVKVQGLTLFQATEEIKQRYTRYIKYPSVALSLKVPRPLQIAVAGEVNFPGSHTIALVAGEPLPTVTQAIRLAGGITGAADVRKIQILRRVGGEERAIAINLWELLQQGQLDQDSILRDGDKILIPTVAQIDPAETRQIALASFAPDVSQPLNIAVVGEVFRPGTYLLEPDRVDLDDARQSKSKLPTVTKAIELAGGITASADIRHIEVRRPTQMGVLQTQVDLWQLLQGGQNQDVVLYEGDTVFVPTATDLDPVEANSLGMASFAPDTIQVYVVGEVVTPGIVNVSPNTPLNQALLAAGGFNNRRARKGSVDLIRLQPNGTVAKRKIGIDFAQGIDEETNPALRHNDVIVVKRSGLTSFTDTLGTVLSPLSDALIFLRIFQ